MSIEKIAKVWPEWQVTEQIGEGSFGKVYKAVRQEHNMTAFSAIKVISVPQNSSEVSALRLEGMDENASKTYFQGIVNDFINEIKLMESMKGTSNIVSVEDFRVIDKDDSIGWDIFIRMELLTSFNDYISVHTLSRDEIIKLGVDVCSALELCAQRNIIHRDIKPENLFVSSFGDFKVGDFGIARELEKAVGTLSSKGTFSYMAPEVAAGGHYDATVDIYSLGIVLYKLLNNNRLPFVDPYAAQILFQDKKIALDRRMCGEALPAPVNADEQLAEIVLAACAYAPSQRFATPTAMKNALISAGTNSYQGEKSSWVDPNATVTLKNEESIKKHVIETSDEAKFGVNAIKHREDGIDEKKTPKKNKSKAKLVVVLVLVVLLLGGGTVGYFMLSKMLDPSTKVVEALDQGDVDEAADYYDDIGTANNDIIDALKSRIDKVLSDYVAGSMNYAEATKELNTISNMGVSDVSGEVVSVQNKIDLLNNSKIAFDTAKAFETEGNYAGAIEQYKKVSEEDSNYATAMTNLDAAINSYRTKTIENAASCAENSDYAGALKELNDCLEVLENDAEIKKQITVYNSSYESECLEDAEKLIKDKKFEEAKTLLAEALNVLPDSTKISDKLGGIDTLKPVKLNSLVLIDARSIEYGEGIFTDSFGNSFDGAHYIDCVDDGEAYAVYNLEKKYSSFSGSIVARQDTGSEEIMVIMVYVDDTLKYTSAQFGKTTGSIDFNVNVSGGQKLTIKAGLVSGYYFNARCAMVNAMVSK